MSATNDSNTTITSTTTPTTTTPTTTTYVRLISADGYDFFIEKSIAIQGSSTIRLMLEGNFREAIENVITFPDLSAYVLEQVIRYLHYKSQYSRSNSRIPEFPIDPAVALELLIAAKYLDC
jgi:hypothetical protein